MSAITEDSSVEIFAEENRARIDLVKLFSLGDAKTKEARYRQLFAKFLGKYEVEASFEFDVGIVINPWFERLAIDESGAARTCIRFYYEFAKNAFDAGATYMDIIVDVSSDQEVRIVVQDDGEGVHADLVTDSYDHKAAERTSSGKADELYMLGGANKGVAGAAEELFRKYKGNLALGNRDDGARGAKLTLVSSADKDEVIFVSQKDRETQEIFELEHDVQYLSKRQRGMRFFEESRSVTVPTPVVDGATIVPLVLQDGLSATVDQAQAMSAQAEELQQASGGLVLGGGSLWKKRMKRKRPLTQEGPVVFSGAGKVMDFELDVAAIERDGLKEVLREMGY